MQWSWFLCLSVSIIIKKKLWTDFSKISGQRELLIELILVLNRVRARSSWLGLWAEPSADRSPNHCHIVWMRYSARCRPKKARKNSEKWEYTLDVQFLLFSASMIAEKEQLSLQQTSTRCWPMMKVKGSWFFSWLSTTGSISMSLWRRTTSQSSEWMTKWQCSSPYIKLR